MKVTPPFTWDRQTSVGWQPKRHEFEKRTSGLTSIFNSRVRNRVSYSCPQLISQTLCFFPIRNLIKFSSFLNLYINRLFIREAIHREKDKTDDNCNEVGSACRTVAVVMGDETILRRSPQPSRMDLAGEK